MTCSAKSTPTKRSWSFSFRRSHAEADAVLETINGMIRGSGYGFYAMELRETGEVMGFCGISPS